jgi:hypothetical protein
MSDLMLFGVLRMPYEMTMSSEISRRQFYSRVQEAADRIERLERELDQARGAYQGCATALEIANRAASKEAILQHLADQGQDIERELAERKPVSIDEREREIDYIMTAVCSYADTREESTLARIRRMISKTTATQTAPSESFAWAAFAENGNVIIWSRRRDVVESVAVKYGRPVTPVIAYIDGRTAGTAPDERVEDLAALVRKLVRALRKADPATTLADGALGYLKRKGLAGSALRAATPSPLPPKGEAK